MKMYRIAPKIHFSLVVIACLSAIPWSAASVSQTQPESGPISLAYSHVYPHVHSQQFHRTLAAASDSSTGGGSDTPSSSTVFDPLRVTLLFVTNPGFATSDSAVDSLIIKEVGAILDMETSYIQLVAGDDATSTVTFDLYSTARAAPTPYASQSYASLPVDVTLSHASQELARSSLRKYAVRSRPYDQIQQLNTMRQDSSSELWDATRFPHLSKLNPLYAINFAQLPSPDTVESLPKTSGPVLLGGVIAALCVLALCTCALTYLLWKRVNRRRREAMEHDTLVDDPEMGTTPRAHGGFGQMQSDDSQMHTDDLELDIDQLSMEHEDDIRRAHRKGSTSTASVELADRKFEEHKSSRGFPMNVAGRYTSQHVIASSDRELHHGGGSEDEEEDEVFSSRHVRAPSGADLHSARPVALHQNEDETDS